MSKPQRSMKRRLAAIAVLLAASACAAGSLPSESASPEAARAEASNGEPQALASQQEASTEEQLAVVPAALGQGAAPKKQVASLSAPGAEAEGQCPEGMQLVSGEYCSRVEHKCIKSWFDKSNKKTVCEEFEPVSKCVGSRSSKQFCIDTYAWPNRRGERPEVMNRFHQAQVKCAAVGKRLCTESEWTMSCEGPKMKPFPHGYTRDSKKCHGDQPWDSPNMKKVAQRDEDELSRLWVGVRSGSQAECVSDYGVADLPGNNDEIVASETFTNNWKGKFDSVHTGGPWYKGVRNQCRPKIYTHDEGFYYYFLGFRCCSEAGATATDPRTPKQRKKNWDFSRVERIAGFTREQVKEALEKKSKQGNCGCKARDKKCRTLCGTLLGPKTRDHH